MPDKFENFSRGLSSPIEGGFNVTPSDTADLPQITRALSVAVPGQVSVTFRDGSQVDLFVAAGIPLPLRVARVWATGTTATGIVGLI